MGTLDTVLIIGAIGGGAWLIWTYKDQIFGGGGGGGGGGCPEGQTADELGNCVDDGGNGNGNGDGKDGNGGSGDYDCKKACKNCWCRSYSEKCSGSCSKCCGGSRIASKCGGKGVKSCGGGGSGGGGGGDSGGFSMRADVIGAGLGRYQSYQDMYYPHNKRAMRVSIA